MNLKNLVFYTVAGSVIAWVAQALGASLGVTLMASLLGPPLLLIAWVLYRNRGGLS